ncbi:hypothetical protein TRFO_38405 [Tritrichomonas foetus]|uniref:EGF-like domain-containing protein n=1 Tax=Tritrichomonas foetus TaxID=1144522 RepID=A0A1J4JB74_9EUKA|nr:hypothetical protein TRFO_38405 [Tritrichomonas foetus]|eukprot:OHS95487.1 hypothetical protein TRFO_38405 [Tritrichomonas foetus]
MFVFILFLFCLSEEKESPKPTKTSNSKQESITKQSTSKSERTKLCGPNSYMNIKGECICKRTHPFGDPKSEEGCWDCGIKCHEKANCVSKLKCQCFDNYLGDGVLQCFRPLPKVKNIHPRKCDSEIEEIFFIAETFQDFTPNEVFCKFGSFTTRGELVNSTFYKCPCPSLRNGKILSGISYDGEFWSSPMVKIDFRQNNDFIEPPILTSFVFIVLSSLVVITAAAIFWFRGLSYELRNGDADEVLPLNKWHMHQIQQEIGDESRVIDFIMHMIKS